MASAEAEQVEPLTDVCDLLVQWSRRSDEAATRRPDAWLAAQFRGAPVPVAVADRPDAAAPRS